MRLASAAVISPGELSLRVNASSVVAAPEPELVTSRFPDGQALTSCQRRLLKDSAGPSLRRCRNEGSPKSEVLQIRPDALARFTGC